MKTPRTQRASQVMTGMLCLLLISSVFSESFSNPRPVFAQTSTEASRVQSAPGSKEARGDVVRFSERVQAALASTGNDKAFWGVMIKDADNGEVLYSVNARRYFMPASNAKLFTTAMALATLGPDFRVRTTVESATEPDSSGLLAGDLVLVGRGDANLSSRVIPFVDHPERNGPPEKALADLTDQVVKSGVREISGDVVADDSYFVPERYPPGWGIDDAVWSYGAAISALAINDNYISVILRPGATVGAPLVYSAAPWPGIYEFRNDALTSAAGTEPKLRLERDLDSQTFRLTGTLPLDAPAREMQLAVTQPAENAAAILMQLLQARGVRVDGHSRARHSDRNAQPQTAAPMYVLAEHSSPALVQDVRLTNKLSMNLHAELLLRVAAKEKGAAMTMDDAVAFATAFRQGIGIGPDEVELTDGSGLSRGDLITPQSVVQLLSYAARQPWGSDFVASLPVAGQDGTLENRMRGTVAAGQVHAKTGLVEHVNSLSGYATTRRGAHLIFAIFGNNTGTHGPEALHAVDAICVAMVEELAPHREARTTRSVIDPSATGGDPEPQAPRQISR